MGRTLVTGGNNGKIIFEEGCNVSGLKNKIKDRGIILETDAPILVGASTDEPDPNRISAGSYIWDGTYFSKPYDITFTAQQIGGESTKADSTSIELTFNQDVTGLTWNKIAITNSSGDVTFGALSGSGKTWTIELLSVNKEGVVEVSVQDFGEYHVITDVQEVMVYKNMTTSGVSGTMNIGGEVGKNLAKNQSGTGWTWERETATLTLTSDYVSSNNIWINCKPTDTIHLVYSGDVTISAGDSALSCEGSLSISGNGTLTLESTNSGALWITNGNLNILSGKLIATGTTGISNYGGDIIIESSANVTATSTENALQSGGIQTNKEHGIFINGATVSATSRGYRQYDGALVSGNITISGGIVNLSAYDMKYVVAEDGILNITGDATLKIDDTQVYLTTLMLDDVNKRTYISEVTEPASNYGIASRYTSADGKLFFLLPEGNQTVTLKANGDTYTNTVNVTTDHEASALLRNQSKTYTVTVNGSYAAATGEGSYVQGETVTINAGSRSNYSFDSWSANGVTLANSDKAVATFTMPANNVTVTANWRLKDGTGGSGGSGGGSSSGGSSSSSSGSLTSTTPSNNTPSQPVTVVVPVVATKEKDDVASVSILDQAITDAIAKAQDDAKKQGKTTKDITVALNVTMPDGSDSLTATLTRDSLSSLVNAGIGMLEINGSPIKLAFDLKALEEILKQSDGDISITIAPSTNLSASAKAIIGTRPVYDLKINYTKDGKNATVSNFGDGKVTVSMSYSPASGESVGELYGVYVDEKGNATRIPGSAYDANSGSVILTTTHFSLFGIGYTAPKTNFTDIANHWAKGSIDYVVSIGLLNGTKENTFDPNTAMTRGMLVTALGRLADVDAKAYTTSSFTDVKANSAFNPYIEWAYEKGIVRGTGSGKFEPDRAITREEIAVIFVNFANATGYTLPKIHSGEAYADASSIGSSYKVAVTAMQQAGIMMGGSGNKFNPKSSATRAELSTMLHRYILLTISSDTTQF